MQDPTPAPMAIMDPSYAIVDPEMEMNQGGAFLHDRYANREGPNYDETPVEPMKRQSTKFILDETEGDGVRNHQFQAWLEDDRRHTLNCKTLPLTMLTWLSFLFVAWGHGNIDATFRMRECLKGVIQEVKARHTVTGIGKDQIVQISLSDVTSVGEMWSWIEGGLVPAMAGPPTKPGFVRTFNKVVGSIQLRETRFQSGECQVGDDLTAFYRQGCHTAGVISSAPYGPNAVGGDKFLMDPAFNPGYGISGLSSYNSQRFFSWLDIHNATVGKMRANYLRTSRWVDDGTKSLEAVIVFFNSEIQAYGHVNIKLMLERGGLIKVDLQVRAMWATIFTGVWYHLIADIVWVLCILKFIANSVQKAVDNKTAKTCIARWCKLHKQAGGGYWLGLDWLGIIVALGILFMLVIFLTGFGDVATSVGLLGSLGSPRPMLGNETFNQAESYDTDYGQYYGTNAKIIEDLEGLVWFKGIHKCLMFWYAMIFLARWFKGFRGQARMAQITSTLAGASADLAHFAIIFGVLFINFAIAGHVLFGSEVPEWSTVNQALQSALAMAWGRVDYSPLHEIAPYSAMLWLCGYVLTMCMISMNMLLAIISDHYGDCFHANNAGEKGDDLFAQIWAVMKDIWWNSSYALRYIYKVLYRLFPKRIKNFAPVVKDEELREEIPFDNICQYCEMNPLGYSNELMLRRAGCDKATALHLMKKCEDEVLRHMDEFYPLEQLFDEFDESMQQYYFAMDSFSNELRSWFAEKSIGAQKMIPRQTKLDALSTQIEVAEHIEHQHHHHHSAETMEGKGVHHHHHKSGNADPGSGGEKSATNSQINSQSQSRAESRLPSHVTQSSRSKSYQ